MFRFTSLVEFTVRLDGGGAPATLAREPAGTYDTAPAIASAGPATGRLDRVAEIADIRDRLMGELVGLLVSVSKADDLAELTGGMSLHVWLQHAGRCTRKEVRDVLGAVDVLRHMPATLVGLADRWLSWSQTMAITRAARRVHMRQRSDLDGLVASAMVAHRNWEPDALVADVWDSVDARQPSRLEEAEAAAGRDHFLSLSPDLFGGGSMYSGGTGLAA